MLLIVRNSKKKVIVDSSRLIKFEDNIEKLQKKLSLAKALSSQRKSQNN